MASIRKQFVRRAATTGLMIVLFSLLTIILFVFFRRPETTALLCEGYPADKSCVRRFIYDFQGLISGMLAVAAAWWTISTMHNVHKEQIFVATKANVVRVKRFVGVIVPALGRYRQTIYNFEQRVPQGAFEPKWDHETRKTLLYAIFAINKVQVTLSDPVLEECVPLFDVDTTNALRELRTWVTGLLERFTGIADPFVIASDLDDSIRPTWYTDYMYVFLADLRGSIDTFIDAANRWSETELSMK